MQYRFGSYCFDPARYELRHAGTLVPLRPKACELLAYLLRHRDRVVPKEELLAQVWPGQYVGDGVLHACVLAVRTALHDTGRTPALLHTVRGRGYRFVAPVEVCDLPLDDASPVMPPLRSETPPAGALLPPPAMPETPAAAAGLHAGGEYKPVSVLCCGLAAAPALPARLGAEGLYRLLQTVVELAQEVLQPYVGTLLPPTSEGITAVFGAPVAQEDHARRAVLAALELHQRLRQHPALRAELPLADLAMRMGVYSGLVVVGEFGQDAQRFATVVGAPVHLARRLQEQAAPGTILLSATTYQLVHAEARVEPGGSLVVDGSPTPMPVYTLQGLLGRHGGVVGQGPRAHSPFVGRERELALLHDRFEAVRAGEGQVVSLVGPPGMGKTRLLTEFGRRLAPDQVTWYGGHCLAYGQAIPYLPVRDFLRQFCALVEGDNAEARTAAVQHRLHASGISVAEDMALLCQLLDLPVAPELLAPLSPETRQARTFALLGHLIRQEAQQRPLVLAVEDVHWIDPTSAAWLGALVERLAGTAVLLLVTARPGYQPPWGTHARVTQLALPPLRAEESQAIVAAVPGTAQLPVAQCQQIIAHGTGNPFFVEELAWHAVEHGLAATPVPVPETVHAVLAARLDRLPAAAKALLQTAAVIGPEVPVSLVQAIAELPEDAVHQGLAHLQATELLSETRLVPEWTVTFPHVLTQEVAYGSLLQERRRALHARIVEALEALASDRVGEQVERLAHHALRGEVWDKAVAYARQAGEKALARSAYAEAVHALDQALEALARLPERPTTLAQAIDVRLALRYPMMALGQYQALLARLHEAASRAEVLGDHERQGWVAVQLALAYRNVADYAAAIDAGHRALRVAADLGNCRLEAEATLRLGQAYWAKGDFGQALVSLEQSLDALAGQPDHAAAEAERHGWLAFTLSRLGRFGDALAQAEQALRLAEAHSDVWGRIQAYAILGEVALLQGDLPRAIKCLEQSVGLARTWDVPDWGESAIGSLGTAYMLAGRWAEAISLAEEAIELTRATGQLDDLTASLCGLGEVYLCAGRLDAAHEQAQQALEHARQHTERAYEGRILCLLGAIAAQREPAEIAQAHDCYQQALALANELGMRPLRAHCHRSLGTLYAITGQQEQAGTELSIALEMYRAMEMTFWLPQTEAVLAQVSQTTEGGVGLYI
jgi:class 3 adenylate cyclase/tetratricopeptide (TPR) repeat protein